MTVLLILGLTLWSLFSSYLCYEIIPSNYTKAIKPPSPDGKPSEIRFSFRINGIQEIDNSDMSLKMQMYMRVSWIDERLNFPYSVASPADDGTRMVVNLNPDVLQDIWVPDHFIRRTRSLTKFDLLRRFEGVKFFNDTEIWTSSMIEVKVGCPMDFRTFPFDQQTCEIIVASYFHFLGEIAFKWDKRDIVVDDELASKQLSDFELEVVKKGNVSHCECQGCAEYYEPCVQFNINLRRYYFGHVIGYIIPSTLFMCISWGSFFWPPDVVPGRTVLIITSLLAVSDLYAESRKTGPQVSYIKASDVWMFFCIIVTSLTLLQYAILLQWVRKQQEALSNSKKDRSDDSSNPKYSACNGRRISVTPFQNVTSKKEIHSTSPYSAAVIMKYKMYQRRTENIGRIGIPILVFSFNVVYWIYVLHRN